MRVVMDLDMADLARELAENIDMQEVADAMDMEELARSLNMGALAAELDMDELAAFIDGSPNIMRLQEEVANLKQQVRVLLALVADSTEKGEGGQ